MQYTQKTASVLWGIGLGLWLIVLGILLVLVLRGGTVFAGDWVISPNGATWLFHERLARRDTVYFDFPRKSDLTIALDADTWDAVMRLDNSKRGRGVCSAGGEWDWDVGCTVFDSGCGLYSELFSICPEE